MARFTDRSPVNIMLRNGRLAALGVLAISASLVACAASPRTRPLNTGPINNAADSTQGVRRQLQGKWTLLSFETYPAAGQVVKQEAVGELTYDEYGNLVIRGALTGVPAGEQANLLHYSGRAVVDPPNHRLILQALQGQGADALPAAVANDQVRYYEFDGDVLKLTLKDGNGRPTATVTWKRAQ
jgi:hypothetical protein